MQPYVGKFETKGNHRINTHMSDTKQPDPIEVDIHFGQPGHVFQHTQGLLSPKKSPKQIN